MLLTSQACKATLLAVATLVAAGCGGPPETSVTGTVLVDGELATSGTVTLHPVGSGAVSSGRIHQDGSFIVKTGQGDRSDPDKSTIAPGEYIVTVVVNAPPQPTDDNLTGPPRPGGRLSAAKYADKSTSDLRFTFAPGSQVLSLSLERAAPEPSDDAVEDQSESADTATDDPVTESPEAGNQSSGEPAAEEEQPND